MMELVAKAYADSLITISRIISGRLLTEEQITNITSHTVGKYFADFFPTPEEERRAEERFEEAKIHISRANEVILGMQRELESKKANLEKLLGGIEEKQSQLHHYTVLAETNKEKFSVLRAEMEEALRQQLEIQSKKGRRWRQLISFIIWIFTIALGAALGAYFKDIVVLLT